MFRLSRRMLCNVIFITFFLLGHLPTYNKENKKLLIPSISKNYQHRLPIQIVVHLVQWNRRIFLFINPTYLAKEGK